MIMFIMFNVIMFSSITSSITMIISIIIIITTITPILPTNIVDVRGFDSSTISILRGGNSQARGGFPGKFESSNLSRRNVSREIGRSHTVPANDHMVPWA